MFTSALFTIAKTWKQPKRPSTEEWIKMWCVYTYSFRGSSYGEESVCNAGDPALTSGLGRPLGSLGMATHSSILAWRIPWTEEPGWLQSMGSQSLGTTEQIYIQQNDFWVVIVLKNPLAEAGDMRDVGSSPGWGRSLERHGNTLQ